MNLKNYQTLLAKLYTDKKFRLYFWENPQKIGKEFGIDEKIACELATQNKIDIERYGQILVRKRLNAFENICPKTAKWLGNRLLTYFEKFATNLEDTPDRYQKDAYQFAKYIKKQDIFKKELLDFEQKNILIEWLDIRTDNLFFRYKFLWFNPYIYQRKIGFYIHFGFKGKYFRKYLHF